MINLELTNRVTWNKDLIQAPDISDRFTAEDLDRIGNFISDGYEKDEGSRSTWMRRTQAALDMAMQVSVAKTFPWPGASNVIFPLITIGALQFSANAYTSLIQGDQVVDYRVIGPDPGGRLHDKAERLGKYMSWQMLEQDCAWEDEHDRLLIYMAIVGSAFTKSYMSGKRGHIVSEFVSAADLVVNYWTKNLESCPRLTHLIRLSRNDIYTGVMNQFYRDVRQEDWYQSTPPTYMDGQKQAGQDKRLGIYPQSADEFTPFQVLEQHVNLDLDQDGYDEPYIATVERSSRKLLRLACRVESESAVERNHANEIIDIHPHLYFTKYPFIPSPDGGFYECGFGTFLGPMNDAVNAGINQLIDAGTVQNSNGGFLGRGVKMRGGTYTIAPFEWKRIDSMGDDIRKNMVPFPKSEPSQVTLKLIELLIEYASRVAGTIDVTQGANPGQNTPASTYQGMSEKGMKIYSMIFKRVWHSLKNEAKLRFILNRIYCRTEQYFGSQNTLIRKEDFSENSDQIAPVADPNTPSATMQLIQAQAVAQRSMMVSGYDVEAVEKGLLKALKVNNIDQIYPGLKKGHQVANPKMQDLQVKAGKLKLDRLRYIGQLHNTKKHVDAQVVNLHAQAAKTLKEAGVTGSKERLEAFRLATDILKQHGDIVNQRIQAMTKDHEDDEQEEAGGDRGGVSGLAPASGDAGAGNGAGSVEDGNPGAVGSEGVPGGSEPGANANV